MRFLSSFLIGILFWSVATIADEASVQFVLKPRECVVLQEGDKCYANVRIHWYVTAAAEHCLYMQDVDAPLKCWNDNQGQFSKKINTSEDITFYLQSEADEKVLAEAKLVLAWVHEKSARPLQTWRLF